MSYQTYQTYVASHVKRMKEIEAKRNNVKITKGHRNARTDSSSTLNRPNDRLVRKAGAEGEQEESVDEVAREDSTGHN